MNTQSQFYENAIWLMAADARLRCIRFCRLASSGSSLGGSLRSWSSRSKASSGASEQWFMILSLGTQRFNSINALALQLQLQHAGTLQALKGTARGEAGERLPLNKNLLNTRYRSLR